MLIILAFIPILIGAALAFQSAVNSKLRSFVISPLTTSMISFLVGTIFLSILTFSIDGHVFAELASLKGQPIWIYAGGLLGVLFLTINIVLFKKIGSIQTAVLPILGQIVMGALIDQFGLIYSPKMPVTMVESLGLLLVVIGVLLATEMLFAKNELVQNQSHIIWKVIGVLAGMVSAVQSAINGHLGTIVGSSIVSANISFVVGLVILILLVVITRSPVATVKNAAQTGVRYWWIWIGGLLGATYVLGCAYLVPKIGTGQLVVMALFGQLLCSVLIDKFGLFGATKKYVNRTKILGLIAMFIGVMIINL